MNGANQPIKFYQVESGSWSQVHSEIITEMPVSLTINGDIWLTFMCTPVQLEALAVGFLYNEGMIQSLDDIVDVRVCPTGDNVDVWLTQNVEKPDRWLRTTGCTGGVTSVITGELPAENGFAAGSPDGASYTPAQIGHLIGELFASQDLYRKSGGVHTSALSDGRSFYAIAEDIGRHNTLDKIAGLCLIERISLPQRVLVTTGRISSEMMQKAQRIGANVVISRTSPSSLSIQLAKRYGITLIGYARRDRFNIYTYPERIDASQKQFDPPNPTSMADQKL